MNEKVIIMLNGEPIVGITSFKFTTITERERHDLDLLYDEMYSDWKD